MEIKKEIKKYVVTTHFRSNTQVIVEAESEEEALEKAECIEADVKQILDRLVIDGFCDVEEL